MADQQETILPDACDRTTATDPPIVKAIAARGVAIQLIIAQLAELAGIGAITYALIAGKLTEQTFGMLFGALMSGTIVGKMRGKPVVPLTSLLVTIAPSLAKGGAAATAVRHVFALFVLPAAVVLALAVPVTGCAAFFAALPLIVSAATSAGQVIDAIESFVSSRNLSTPEVERALQRARSALVAVLHAANGAHDMSDRDLQAALAEFEQAYAALVDVTSGLGVRVAPESGALMSAAPGLLTVPSAHRLRAELEGAR